MLCYYCIVWSHDILLYYRHYYYIGVIILYAGHMLMYNNCHWCILWSHDNYYCICRSHVVVQ